MTVGHGSGCLLLSVLGGGWWWEGSIWMGLFVTCGPRAVFIKMGWWGWGGRTSWLNRSDGA